MPKLVAHTSRTTRCAPWSPGPHPRGAHGPADARLSRSGRHTDALAAFHHLRYALREGLATTPGPDVHRLTTAILTGHPRLEPPPPHPGRGPHLVAA
ncbi:BTAD domain-containing putative transcriptional regulator [Streptomyces sp. SCSIO 30461]|uniref:BTAD domain-containing putative transcriptional regulator n=1 Tax=Streptomyces sp. SCSIO 30461 TaxID=3118085 RepID=UPI00387EBDC7